MANSRVLDQVDAALDVVFRPARREDLPAIVAMLADDPLGRQREAPGEPLDPAYEAAFEAMARQGGTELIVAESAGQVVGCLQLYILPGMSHRGMSRGQVESVRVAAGHRGEGLGEALIRHAVDRSRTAGCGMVQLTSSLSRTDARRFYERLGFVHTHAGMKLDLSR